MRMVWSNWITVILINFSVNMEKWLKTHGIKPIKETTSEWEEMPGSPAEKWINHPETTRY